MHVNTRAAAASLAAAALLVGCAGTPALMPTPAIYIGDTTRRLFAGTSAEPATTAIDLLYVTDRAAATAADAVLPYTSDRSRSMAFGSVSVEIGQSVAWPTLVEMSMESPREQPLSLRLGAATELGRFPPIPYAVEVTPGRDHASSAAVMDVHERAAADLQAEVARRIAAAPRKEVLLFVHGYANTFQDAAFSMADLCHFLGREFVCAIFTWPAGGSRGLMAGYNVDRESGEFAVQHLKQTIRLISQSAGRRAHPPDGAQPRNGRARIGAARTQHRGVHRREFHRRALPGQEHRPAGPGHRRRRRGGEDLRGRFGSRSPLRRRADAARSLSGHRAYTSRRTSLIATRR